MYTLLHWALKMKLKQTFISLKRISLQLFAIFKKEAKRGHLYHAIQDPKRRTQHALGLKRQTFSR